MRLNDTTLNHLKQKHPCQSEADKHFLFDDLLHSIHNRKYECINAEVIRNTAMYKRWSGPSGTDAVWRILTSNSFGKSSADKCMDLDNVAKLYVESDQTDSLEVFLASRLIPLDKNPGLPTIRVGEVIRRIISKAVFDTLKEDIIRSVGNLQVCAGHESGCEAFNSCNQSNF